MKKMSVWFLIILFMTSSAVIAIADEISDLEQQMNSIDSQKNSIAAQKAAEQSKKNDVQKQVNSITSAQTKVQTDLKQTTATISTINNDIKAIDKAIQDAEDNYQKQKDLFKTRVRLMYENSTTSNLEYFIQSKSLSDFFAKAELMSLIAQRDRDIIKSLETAKLDIEFKKKLKEDEKTAEQTKQADQTKALTALQNTKTQAAQQLTKINSTLAALERQEDALNAKSAELTQWIKNLKSKRTGGYVNGAMVWPTPSTGYITSYYGNRMHPVLKYNRFHSGIDIGASYGASIVSANKGTVILSGWQSGYGNTVIIDHGGGITTLYGHASTLLVGEGDEVGAGDLIAKVGSTGMSTGPHLHFEVRVNGETANPLDYVGP